LATKKLFILDWNGTLRDDLHYIYECGVERIFRHFGLPCPSLETYRNEVTADFMLFYWAHGIPRDVTSEQLDAIMIEGFKERGRPADMFPGAGELIQGIRDHDHFVAVVSAYNPDKLIDDVVKRGLADKLHYVVGGVRDKPPVFRKLMKMYGIAPEDTICVGDQVEDAEAALAVGSRALVVPHGFHPKHRFLSVVGPLSFYDNLIDILELAD
jgi:phosphoglycolate phosphatase-like HAD superfamily hydrolase